MEKQEIIEGFDYVTSPSFTFRLEDEKERQFGILFETLDMQEATGEEEYEQYPFIVSASIMAHNCHPSFDESDHEEPSHLDLIYDVFQYMGGVPIDHTLANGINRGLEAIKSLFTIDEAMVKKITPEFGTIAAQFGKNYPFEYLQFKTAKAASRYVDFLIEDRLGVFGILIGFALDRPINMVGDTGWDVIKRMVTGKE